MAERQYQSGEAYLNETASDEFQSGEQYLNETVSTTLDQTRMSTFNIGMPWRSGSMVNPLDTGFTAANRQASGFMYAGILAQTPGGFDIRPVVYHHRNRN